jgi:hypothetical protein
MAINGPNVLSSRLHLACCPRKDGLREGRRGKKEGEIREKKVRLLAILILVAACSDVQQTAPTLDMSGTYAATEEVSGGTSRLVFTGPGYCRWEQDHQIGPVVTVLDGRCELRNGGLEFNGGAMGPVLFFQVRGGDLVQDLGNGRVQTLRRVIAPQSPRSEGITHPVHFARYLVVDPGVTISTQEDLVRRTQFDLDQVFGAGNTSVEALPNGYLKVRVVGSVDNDRLGRVLVQARRMSVVEDRSEP